MSLKQLVSTILLTIRNNDLAALDVFISKLPLGKLSLDANNKLLGNLLNECASYNRTDAVHIIFKVWLKSSPQIIGIYTDDLDVDEMEVGNFPGLYASLYYTPGFTIKMLSICAQAFKERYSPLHLFLEFSKYKNSDIITKAAAKVFNVYGDVSKEMIEAGLNLADDHGADYLFNYLAEQYKPLAPYKNIPPWMKNFQDGDKIPLETEIKIPHDCQIDDTETSNQLSYDEAFKLLTAGLETYIDQESVKNKQAEIATFLRIASRSQKDELLRPIVEKRVFNNFQDDEYLFRVLGPSNPFIDASLEELKMDDSRMFNCLRFDVNDTVDDQIDDWFTGNCLTCLKRIRRRFHAVRRPVSGGGWVECFCSWQCARIRVSQLEGYYNGDNQQIGAFEIVKFMINIYERQVYEIGIQDRITLLELEENDELQNIDK